MRNPLTGAGKGTDFIIPRRAGADNPGRHWLGRAWNLPNTLLGLAGGLGGRGRVRRGGGVVEIAGGWLIGLLRRLGWAEAITLGDVILYAHARLIPTLHGHEMVHVRQGRRWGPLFLPAYVLESAYQWARTGRGYWDNRFEVDARAAGEELDACLPNLPPEDHPCRPTDGRLTDDSG
jgi:hypothetical protein